LAGKVNLQEQFARFDDYWSPKIVASINDYDVKLVKVQGEFVWHQHDETDEVFLVTAGQLRIQLQDRDDVVLNPGSCSWSREGFVTDRPPMRKPRWCCWSHMRPSTPGTPSWRARWVNDLIDCLCGGVRTTRSRSVLN
jgi:hypothetical protein